MVGHFLTLDIMNINEKYGKLATDVAINRTIVSLALSWIHAFVVENKEEAVAKAIGLIPKYSEVMTMTSTTLVELGLDELLNGPEFVSIRKQFTKNNLDPIQKQRLWLAHEWAVWSVHAVSEDWQVMIVSATGSQLGSYAYWATNVLWIVWTQKIVKNLEEATNRIKEYTFPLENQRAMKEYWVWSWINKILIINKEVTSWRIHLIFIKEKLGF